MPIDPLFSHLNGSTPRLEKKLASLDIFKRTHKNDNVDEYTVNGMVGLGSGEKYERSKLFYLDLPLSFDQVMEGRYISSSAPLLYLPTEILWLIAQHVDSSDLANLALVNRDCRQLARSRQFKFITLDYSMRSFHLLFLLHKELGQRASNTWGGFTPEPSIGVCIRGIRVATNPYNISSLHRVTKPRWFETHPSDQRLLCCMARVYHGLYLGLLEDILSDRKVLPHLKYFHWTDNTCLTEHFCRALTQSNIENLIMANPWAGMNVPIVPPSVPGVADWPLKNLHITFTVDHWAEPAINSSRLCASILRQCAPTLESLVWGSGTFRDVDAQSFGTDPGNIPRFINLRRLVLRNHLAFQDTQTLNALLQAPIRHLASSTEDPYTKVKAECFGNRGKIPTLESFIWTQKSNWTPGSRNYQVEEWSLDFLRSNNQLQRLSVPYPISVDFGENQLLPVLSESFRYLTTLNLNFREHIPASTLTMISSLGSLENLQIRASTSTYVYSGWHANHDDLRTYLAPLQRLKKFSVLRDIYDGVDTVFEPSPGEGPGSIEYMPRPWSHDGKSDSNHLRWMQEEADKYAVNFPRLEWLYIGQWQFGIASTEEPGGVTSTRSAYQLADYRQVCSHTRNKIFGDEYYW